MSFEVKGWCPSPARPMETGDGWLMRLKPLGGRLTAEQARAIAAASKLYGNGQLELTSRGSLQLRGVAQNRLAACQRQLGALGIEHQGALAAITLAPYLDGFDLAHDLAPVLARFPALPSKFCLVIDCGPAPLLTECPGDLRLERSSAGLCLRIEGRTHALPVTRDTLPEVLTHILAAFCAEGIHGGRGRMRDWGHDFGETVLPQAPHQPAPGPFAGHILHLLPFGALSADLLERAACTGPVTITPWRMIGLSGALDDPDLITDPASPFLRIHACVGAPACAQGLAPTRPLARRLANRLGLGQTLHVAGCAKHCAHPAPTTITLTATAQGFCLPGGRPIQDPEQPMRHSYETNGQAIYDRSFAIIRAEADLARFSPIEERVAVRMIHAAGLVGLERDIRFTPDFARAATEALQAGAPILCDARMVSQGITVGRMPAKNEIICTLHDPEVAVLAAAMGNTRSAAALELWRPHLAGAVVAIGNAPTALFHLLNMLEDPDCPRPAAIIGCPVGFVGAAESKEALITAPPVPAMVVTGRLGGSAVTVAAVNALASEKE